jgi:hypothetical protein
MRCPRTFFAVTSACLAATSLIAALLSSWYLWHFASRVPDPDHGVVHAWLLGDRAEVGYEFTVYLSSTQYILLSPGAYLTILGVTLLFILPRCCFNMHWRKP